ncbi:SDR family oxidoreductase [Qipengyuania psychrotolerans]|uniref:SDR family oxidoreductase n=1 Tax=Qipengyuania psychrotolerans TaxID=2867238 RepID=A0ABX8ZG80_9SPHN|nr:SDR family oxidoreductase [Qipengyuania psychrotolerans]QZD87736.1 SDR family oxidoreductase [Qipengyuania psychrotolerans]
MQKLDDKLCMVTGGARGIGKAVCAAFLSEGARVILTDIDEDEGRKAAGELGCEFARLDVSDEADWNTFELAFPAIDVLVNNAGITGFEGGPAAHDPENASLEEWRRVHAVNTDGTFMGCRYALRAMKAKGSGSIINMSSRSGLVGIPGAAAYAASKAAIRNHSKSVALYAAQNGWAIRCNSVHPAAILTPIWEPMLGDGPDRDEKMAALVADTPLKRFGTVEEVAALCVYLASDDSGYMTGSELTLDGGLLAGSAASPG